MPALRQYLSGVHAIVGHNLAFDLRMLTQSGVPDDIIPKEKICTWCCARHLWPDAPGFANQTLRYWRELKIKTGPSHRALADAMVTDALLARMLLECTPQKLIELTATPVLQTKVPFGKFRGKLWKDVDIDYCRWLLHPNREPPFNDEVKFAARHWLKIKEDEYKARKEKRDEEKRHNNQITDGGSGN
jgi:DNA polymerase III epsilon subunit-like protein